MARMKASLPSKPHGDFGHRRADVSIGPIFARAMSTHAILAAGRRVHPAPGTEARAGSSRIRGPGGIQQLHLQLAARRLGCVPTVTKDSWAHGGTRPRFREVRRQFDRSSDQAVRRHGRATSSPTTCAQITVPGLVSLFSPQCAAASLLLPWATPR